MRVDIEGQQAGRVSLTNDRSEIFNVVFLVLSEAGKRVKLRGNDFVNVCRPARSYRKACKRMPASVKYVLYSGINATMNGRYSFYFTTLYEHAANCARVSGARIVQRRKQP